MTRLALALLLLGCTTGTDGPEIAPVHQPPPGGGGPLEWQLVAQPESLSMSQRDAFVLRVAVTNRGTALVDTERDAIALNVNGEDSEAFALAFGNGARDRRWAALPPGETVSEERRGLALFDEPGDYTLTLRRGVRVFARARVRVTGSP